MLIGDDFADGTIAEAAPAHIQPIKPEPRSLEPVALIAATQDEPCMASAPETESAAALSTVCASPSGRLADSELIGETDEQGIAGAAPEQPATAAPAGPAAADPIPMPSPAAPGPASMAAAAEAAQRTGAQKPSHAPRAPLPAPALGAGPVQSFKEALPQVSASVLGACIVLLAVALALAWRMMAVYRLLAALLGLAAVLLAGGGYVVTQHVLPLTKPLTRPAYGSIPALARRIVCPLCGIVHPRVG